MGEVSFCRCFSAQLMSRDICAFPSGHHLRVGVAALLCVAIVLVHFSTAAESTPSDRSPSALHQGIVALQAALRDAQNPLFELFKGIRDHRCWNYDDADVCGPQNWHLLMKQGTCRRDEDMENGGDNIAPPSAVNISVLLESLANLTATEQLRVLADLLFQTEGPLPARDAAEIFTMPFKLCAGVAAQFPIEISAAEVSLDASLHPFSFSSWAQSFSLFDAYIIANRQKHLIAIQPQRDGVPILVRDPASHRNDYILTHLLLRVPSELVIADAHVDLEIQLVHERQDRVMARRGIPTLLEIVSDEDSSCSCNGSNPHPLSDDGDALAHASPGPSLLLVSKLLRASPHGHNAMLEAILDPLERHFGGSSEGQENVSGVATLTSISPIRLRDLFLADGEDYYIYSGALSTPPCTKTPSSYVMAREGAISTAQLERLLRGVLRTTTSVADPTTWPSGLRRHGVSQAAGRSIRAYRPAAWVTAARVTAQQRTDAGNVIGKQRQAAHDGAVSMWLWLRAVGSLADADFHELVAEQADERVSFTQAAVRASLSLSFLSLLGSMGLALVYFRHSLRRALASHGVVVPLDSVSDSSGLTSHGMTAKAGQPSVQGHGDGDGEVAEDYPAAKYAAEDRPGRLVE